MDKIYIAKRAQGGTQDGAPFSHGQIVLTIAACNMIHWYEVEIESALIEVHHHKEMLEEQVTGGMMLPYLEARNVLLPNTPAPASKVYSIIYLASNQTS